MIAALLLHTQQVYKTEPLTCRDCYTMTQAGIVMEHQCHHQHLREGCSENVRNLQLSIIRPGD